MPKSKKRQRHTPKDDPTLRDPYLPSSTEDHTAPLIEPDDMAVIIQAVFESGRKKGYAEGYAAGKLASTTLIYPQVPPSPYTITYYAPKPCTCPGTCTHPSRSL